MKLYEITFDDGEIYYLYEDDIAEIYRKCKWFKQEVVKRLRNVTSVSEYKWKVGKNEAI
jgi:adenylate cyclase